MPQYKLAERAKADRLDARAELNSAEMRRDIQRASNYVLGVVLFATSLFFAGMSTKLSAPRLRITLVAIGCIVFLLSVVWIATSPVSVSL